MKASAVRALGENTEQKAERIFAREMARLGRTEADLSYRLKNAPGKLALAARVSQETTCPIRWIAARLQVGSSKGRNVPTTSSIELGHAPLCSQRYFTMSLAAPLSLTAGRERPP